jgi:hypothetical protein
MNHVNCAATLLMGCSSGSLTLNGCYIPQGTPLSYLLAGSPVIVANLWEVTDKDIDRFGKAMLDAWLRERSNPLGCAQCNLVAEEFEAMTIGGIWWFICVIFILFYKLQSLFPLYFMYLLLLSSRHVVLLIIIFMEY